MDIGDTVFRQQDIADKFTTPLKETPYIVASKTGNQGLIESLTGACYEKNATHVKRCETTKPNEMHSTKEETWGNEESVLIQTHTPRLYPRRWKRQTCQ